MAAFTLSFVSLIISGCSDEEEILGSGFTWKSMDSGSSIYLRGVWGSSPTNVYAVGDSGVILHYDGQAWNRELFQAAGDLYDIWGNSPSNIYAVGHNGQIIHFDGAQWHTIPAVDDADYYTVFGVSDTMVFVGFSLSGGSGIGQYNGDSLRSLVHNVSYFAIWGTYGKVNAVAEKPVLDLWVNGMNRQTCYHYDGSDWVKDGPSAGPALWGFSWNAVYCGGVYGEIRKYNGDLWVDEEVPRWGVIEDLWGTYELGMFSVSEGGVVLYSSGGEWRRVDSDTDSHLKSIWGFDNGEAFAVGENGTVIHFGPN